MNSDLLIEEREEGEGAYKINFYSNDSANHFRYILANYAILY